VISREALRAGTGDNIFSFDVSGLHEGLYFLKISSSKGLSDHMKFMKQQE
jgi:hypothetical protein